MSFDYQILGKTDTPAIAEINQLSPNTISYPAQDFYSTLGPIYLPRIYGSNIDTFEVGSSGKIAITLDDIYSLSLHRDVNSNVVYQNASSNDSIKFQSSNAIGFVSDTFNQNANYLNYTANQDMVLTGGDDVFIAAYNNVFVTASNKNISLSADSNVLVAANSNMTLTAHDNFSASALHKDMTLFAASNIDVTADSNMTLVAHDNFSASALHKDMTLFAASNIEVTADSNMTMVAHDNFSASALHKDMTMFAASNIEVTAGSNVSLIAHDKFFAAASNSDMTLFAASNVAVTADSNMTLVAHDNFSASAMHKDMTLFAASNIEVTADSNMTLVAHDNFSASALHKDMTFFAASNVEVTADSNVTLVAHDNFSASALNTDMTLYAKQQLDVTAETSVTMLTPSYDFKTTSSGTPTLHMVNDLVQINGKLEINGVINSIDVTETNLFVQDKLIHLAHDPNEDSVNDGVANNEAGIKIDGRGKNPFNNSNLTDPVFEKSIKWNNNSGIYNDTLDARSYWEVKGGGLAITNFNPTFDASGVTDRTHEVAFMFRINTNSELEFVKRTGVAGSYVYKTVARFGRTLL